MGNKKPGAGVGVDWNKVLIHDVRKEGLKLIGGKLRAHLRKEDYVPAEIVFEEGDEFTNADGKFFNITLARKNDIRQHMEERGLQPIPVLTNS